MSVTTDFRSELLASGLLIDTGTDGLYLRSGRFENVVSKVDDLVSSMCVADEVLYCPPVIPKVTLERSGYQRRSPDLMGTVNEDDELALASVVCHSVYPLFAGRLPKGGRVIEAFGQCFRHEPGLDPFRMQAFRTHEFIY